MTKQVNTVLDRNLITDHTVSEPENSNNYGLRVIAFNYPNPGGMELKPKWGIDFNSMKIIKCSEHERIVLSKTTTAFIAEGLDYHYEAFPADMDLVKFSDIPFVFPTLNYN